MIIGIDGNEANTDKRVGIGQYAFQVITHIHTSKILNPKSKKDIQFKIYLKSDPISDLPKETPWWNYEVFGPQKLWTQIPLPLRLFIETEKPDIFFSPSHYAPRFTLMPSAISIMDLSYIYYPELFTQKDLYQLTHWTEYSVRKATLIFTISEYSKKTIIEHYKVDPQKVVVTYPGYDRTNFQFSIPNFQSKLQQVRSKYNIHDKYILFLGTIQPRKNIEKLIEAFELLKDGNLQLILVGKKGWLYEPIFKRIERSPKKNKIVYIDFATKEESPILYKGAQCFVLPSLYEGFGIPVIEAMASGTPVVVSNVTSLPEIVGDAALKVDPYNAKELANALTQILTQEMVRKMCIQKGLKQALKFSWDDCASKTLKTLVQMGHKKV